MNSGLHITDLQRDLGEARRREVHVPHGKGTGHDHKGWLLGWWEKGAERSGFGAMAGHRK